MLRRYRLFAFAVLAAAGLTLPGLHAATRTLAGAATIAAMGCANSTTSTAVSFPTTTNAAGTATLSSATQVPEPGVPAMLSRSNPAFSFASCGAVFEDSDGFPTDIDGGTIHFHVSPGLIILESNSQDFTIPCGSGGLYTYYPDSCQGGLNHTDLAHPFPLPIYLVRVSPNLANVVHIKADPTASNVSQGWIEATWTRFGFNPFFPPATITSNVSTVQITN